MARRYGIAFWVVVLVVLATFIHEPAATARFAKDAFFAVGEFGGAVVVELSSGGAEGGGS